MQNIGLLVNFQDDLFLKRLKIMDSGCWEFQGFRDRDGYGYITREKTRLSAHRYAYEMFVGDIPDGKMILHSCDNPSCCNPNHLSIGIQDDNMKDASKKARLDKYPMWYKECLI